jgi:hypothetical protein
MLKKKNNVPKCNYPFSSPTPYQVSCDWHMCLK